MKMHITLTRTAPMLVGLLLSGVAGAATVPPAIDGETGVLHVYGSLTESPCRLETASAWQAVDMGNIASALLMKAGDRGQPVRFQLRLKDCQAVTARNIDDRSQSLLWNPHQPAVTVRFTAPADPTRPDLLAVAGVSGLGLRLTDAAGRDVPPGSRGAPLLLTPGQDTLTYTLTPVRTAAPLRAGAWHALVNVGMEYD
ncbi:fimbrial protein [Rahnella sp. ChDrAdgB13]|uniref:fimbrial protein n=1 Tax=Rahnella sp. ChDrAdgB13 TaxID=1850581 RepID=UPI001AD881B1|nr:fimbrial protein [Rahnella sp. ChDrAdgB13]